MDRLLSFSLEGRLPRWRYFIGTVLVGLIQAGLLFVADFLCIQVGQGLDAAFLTLEASIIAVCFWLGFSLGVRRFHDLGWSMWRYVMFLVSVFFCAFIAIITGLLKASSMAFLFGSISIVLLLGVGFIMLSKKGVLGKNKYGSDPLENAKPI